MASPGSSLPQPPPEGGGGPQDQSPTSPAAASPSPAQPSPQMQQGTQMAIAVVNGLRGIAKAFPATAPKVQEINSLMREVLALMMQGQQSGEPAAPPTNG